MISLVAFDLDGTLALSKQAILDTMSEALADLLDVAHVAVISGGDWPQFEKQIASRLPARADLTKLWLLPTTGTKLYTFRDGAWKRVCADLADKEKILDAFELALEKTGFKPEKTWGNRIEDRGSQITFSALGQEGPHRREGGLGSRLRQAQGHSEGSLRAPAGDVYQHGRRHFHQHHPEGRRQGIRSEEAARPEWNPS